MLKRFNVKERNFLMRYALSPTLSPQFESGLAARLKEIGLCGLEDAKAVYFGMDYHLDWIRASLLLATGELTLDNSKSKPQEGGQLGKIEDTDLLVVFEKSDRTLVLVLIEAKGIKSFDRKQINSKANHLKDLKHAVNKASKWLTPIMLLMSPAWSRPTDANCQEFVQTLAAPCVGIWPKDASPQLIWMVLKDFVLGIDPDHSLCIGTCYRDGEIAKTLADRTGRPYTHWRVVPRFPKKK
jgi:hypothetical protein